MELFIFACLISVPVQQLHSRLRSFPNTILRDNHGSVILHSPNARADSDSHFACNASGRINRAMIRKMALFHLV